MGASDYSNYSVKNKIADFEELAKTTKESKQDSLEKEHADGHTLEHNYKNLTKSEAVEHINKTILPVIEESKKENKTTTLKKQVTNEDELPPLLKKTSAKIETKTDQVFTHKKTESDVSSSTVETPTYEQTLIQEEKEINVETPIDQKAEKNEEKNETITEQKIEKPAISKEQLKNIKNKLDSLQNFIAKISTDKSQKLTIVSTDKETGEEELGTTKRGFFNSKSGSSEKTKNLINNALPNLAKQVLETEDTELLGTFKKQLLDIKNSAWGNAITKNNPDIQKN